MIAWLPSHAWWLGGTPWYRENHPFTHLIGGVVLYLAVRVLLWALGLSTFAWWGPVLCVSFLSAFREEVGNVEQPWRAPYQWKPGDIGDIVFATLGAGLAALLIGWLT